MMSTSKNEFHYVSVCWHIRNYAIIPLTVRQSQILWVNKLPKYTGDYLGDHNKEQVH